MKRAAFLVLLGTTALMPFGASAQAPAQQPNAGQTTAQSGDASQAASKQTRAFKAGDMQDEGLFDANGKEVAAIDMVVVGRDNRPYAVAVLDDSFGLGDREVLIPVERIAYRGDRLYVEGYDDAQLKALPVYDPNAGYRDARPDYAVRIVAWRNTDTAADPSQIVVQRRAPAVQVEQAQPQVVVHQAQPDVTVHQPQPQIVVRQAPPTITVEQPQPEIIVRMPKPDVNVAVAKPQVQVTVPPPQVRVAQPQQPAQVQVQPKQAQVTVEPEAGQPDVNIVAADKPQVQYERTGQPRIIYHQADGQPTVRYEQMSQADTQKAAQADAATANAAQAKAAQNQTGQATAQATQTASAKSCDELVNYLQQPNTAQSSAPRAPVTLEQAQIYRQNGNVQACRKALAMVADRAHDSAGLAINEQDRSGIAGTGAITQQQWARARQDWGVGDTNTTGSVTQPATDTRAVSVDKLDDMDVYNLRGQELGSVDRVITDANGAKKYAIVSYGGFLGIGDSHVAIPLERLLVRGDNLVVRGLTEQELEALPDWQRRLPNAHDLGADQTVQLGVLG